MGTISELRKAGLAALATAVLLTTNLALLRTGPPSSHPNAVLAWFTENAMLVQVAAVAWLLAMLALVVFAVSLHDALWASVADRSWTTVLFLHGAGVFATVAVAGAAIGWGLAGLAAEGAISAELVGTLWAIEQALLRFATWGMAVPLLVVAIALYRHSLLGQLCAVAAVLLVGALLVPLTWMVALHTLPAWLALVALTLLVPARSRMPEAELQP